MDDFNGEASVASLVRQAMRIASLRRDYENLAWLTLQTVDLKTWNGDGKPTRGLSQESFARLRLEMSAFFSAEEIEAQLYRQLDYYMKSRAVINGEDAGKFRGDSISQIEVQVKEFKRISESLAPVSGLTPGDTYAASRAADKQRQVLEPVILETGQIVERVRDTIWAFLIETESQLERGQQSSSIFDRAQGYINSALAQHAPAAAAAFVAAQERLSEGSDEALSHALTSCRRVLKDLADALFPATDEVVVGDDGVERVMSDEYYKNRLLEYVKREMGKHAHSTVVLASLQSLGSRLNALDQLANKGVHDQVSIAEAETCIVWTYLFAGDVLRIADGSSALLSRTT
jgi:hypothetical protein